MLSAASVNPPGSFPSDLRHATTLLDEPSDVKAGPTDKTPVIGRNAHGSVQVQGGNFSKLYGKLTPSVVREYLSVTH